MMGQATRKVYRSMSCRIALSLCNRRNTRGTLSLILGLDQPESGCTVLCDSGCSHRQGGG
jgi:hypothetical protein